jgi:hypothetical protein
MVDSAEFPDPRELYSNIRAEAQQHMTDHLQRQVAEHRQQTKSIREAETFAADTCARLLSSDTDYANRVGIHLSAALDRLADLKTSHRALPGLSRETILGLTNGCTMRDLQVELGPVVAISTAKDTQMDVFTPPFRDSWTDAEGGHHQQAAAVANKTSGALQLAYTIGKEGGSAYLAAGVSVAFMRKVAGHPPGKGPAGAAQVRTHTPYDYRWHDVSYLGTAHQHAGFGVTVWSWDIKGGPSRMDQNHTYWRWQDGTSWYNEHNNANWSGFNSDTALNFADQPPYFPIEPDRMYVAWIWCFADADAHGADAASAGFAQGQILAKVNTIVVGQQ